jgi:prepilin-type N-terminal cleavage/methylation domain-containing protein/prepilin-type processing-associated H-X9-DG protein
MKKFTLIELIVVVAIIGILASLLLPSLSRARALAKRATCMNQLKQLGNAMEIYIMDNNDYYPPAYTWSGVNAKASYDDLLSSYAGQPLTTAQINEAGLTSLVLDTSIFQCSEDQLERSSGQTRSYSINGGDVYGTSNFKGLANEAGGSVTVGEVSNTSGTIQLGERLNNGNQLGKSSSAILGSVASHLGQSVHNKEAYYNFSFCDGHVEFLHKGVAAAKQNR